MLTSCLSQKPTRGGGEEEERGTRERNEDEGAIVRPIWALEEERQPGRCDESHRLIAATFSVLLCDVFGVCREEEVTFREFQQQEITVNKCSSPLITGLHHKVY